MTKEEREEAIRCLSVHSSTNGSGLCTDKQHYEAKQIAIKALEQEPKTGQYEKHIDHTDCIWYGSDSGCPVTCSQYRDGWNDAMDYIFKNGKGYQPYKHDY
jgi:hypothetical protein